MPDQPEPFRYVDADQFCLSARLLPDLDTGRVTDTLSISIEGDEPQTVHVPVADLPKILAGLAGVVSKPEPTNPGAAVEVRDRCPHCGDHQLVPRVQMAEHLARLHPEVARRILAGAAASGVQPDTRPTVPCGAEALTVGWHYAHDWQPQPGMAPVRCPGTGAARSVPDTERRAGWATVMGTLDATCGDFSAEIDAVMAKADEEQRDLIARYERELAHMREERGELVRLEATRRDEIHRLRTRLQLVTAETVADVVGPNIDLLCKENARLRAELESANESARKALEHRQEMAEERYAWQERGDRAEALAARLRAELEQARATAPALTEAERDMLNHALNQVQLRIWAPGSAFSGADQAVADSLRRMAAARSGGQAEDGAQPTPAREQRSCGSTTQHPAHQYLRMEVVFQCPGTATDEDGAQQK